MPPKGVPSASAPLVLLVDDSEDTVEAYEQFLRHVGMRVASARDGEEALAKVAELSPDAVVLDLGLPKIDGWDVAKRIKSDPATNRIPVIALTGHATDNARSRALASGVDEFCVKPCLPPDLLAAIRRHLK
jgi:two-component system, cell cycle response regulator DivK